MCLGNENQNKIIEILEENRLKEDLEINVFNILMSRSSSISEEEKEQVLKYNQELQNFYKDEKQRIEKSFFILKMIVQNKRGQTAETICAGIVKSLITFANEFPSIIFNGMLDVFHHSQMMKVEEIIACICKGNEEERVLCDMISDFLMNDLLEVQFDQEKCISILSDWYLLNGSNEPCINVYKKFCLYNEACMTKYVKYLLNNGCYQEISDLAGNIKMNNRFYYDALIYSYDKLGNIELKKKILFDYFREFPSIEVLENLLAILNEEEIECYRSQIMDSAMKSREILKEVCMRIGNADDLYFLLRKGNLSLSERIQILSRHTIELYKKDAECTLFMLKKDLMSLLHSCKFSESQLQDLVFSMTKLKKGRELLNDILEKIEKEENKKAIKTIIKSVMEENHYVYGENYEAKSWS